MKTLYPTPDTLYPNKRGFVALFAVLISSIVVTISFGILTIALKEIVLSSTGRESQFGFYAADAGVECALYWDIKGASVFPTSTIPGINLNYRCNDQDITSNWSTDLGDPSDGAATTTFKFGVELVDPSVLGVYKSCATVKVGKGQDSTLVESYGYNSCGGSGGSSPNTNDPRIIERGIRVTY